MLVMLQVKQLFQNKTEAELRQGQTRKERRKESDTHTHTPTGPLFSSQNA